MPKFVKGKIEEMCMKLTIAPMKNFFSTLLLPVCLLMFCGFDKGNAAPNIWKVGETVTFQVNGVAFEMMPCPAGQFTMGSPEGETGGRQDEKQHAVTISKAFLMGKYEVTQAQYQAIAGGNPSKFKGDNLPVEFVTYHDAIAFCDKLNAQTEGKRPQGYVFALPTEAQWEYACRAGTAAALNSGHEVEKPFGASQALDKIAWYFENSKRKTHEVGGKKPNSWGIYDMHGNVSEWCRDWYEKTYPSGSVTDPTGPSDGSWRRVHRGGHWKISAGFCRSAHRASEPPNKCYFTLGFRLALVPVQ